MGVDIHPDVHAARAYSIHGGGGGEDGGEWGVLTSRGGILDVAG